MVIGKPWCFLFLQPTLVGGRPGVFQPQDANGVYGYYALGANATASGQTNAYADLNERIVDNPTDNLLTSASVEAAIFPELKFKTNFGVNSINGSNIRFQPGNDRSLNAP